MWLNLSGLQRMVCWQLSLLAFSRLPPTLSTPPPLLLTLLVSANDDDFYGARTQRMPLQGRLDKDHDIHSSPDSSHIILRGYMLEIRPLEIMWLESGLNESRVDAEPKGDKNFIPRGLYGSMFTK